MSAANPGNANDTLSAFGVPLATRSSIDAAAVAAGVSLEAVRTNGYVSIKASGAAQIALYVHKTEVSIALDPVDAEGVAGAHASWRLEPAKAGVPTRYVRVGHGSVSAYGPEVQALFVEALGR